MATDQRQSSNQKAILGGRVGWKKRSKKTSVEAKCRGKKGNINNLMMKEIDLVFFSLLVAEC